MSPGQMTDLERAAALADAGNLAEAEKICKKLLRNAPRHFDALHQYALILARQQKFDEALKTIERALSIKPDAVGAHVNRGNLLRMVGRLEEALGAFDAALALDPNVMGIHNNRGNLLWQLGRDEEAIAAYRHVLGREPNRIDALLNCGRSFAVLKRYAEAEACYEKVLAQDPNHFACLYNYGVALEEQGKIDPALLKYKRARQIAPDDVGALNVAFGLEMVVCDWGGWADQSRRMIEAVRQGKPGVAPLHFIECTDDPADQLACARLFAAKKFPPSSAPLWTGQRYRHDRIRVAYVSSDLRNHPVAYLTSGLFEAHDRARFEIVAISSGAVKESAERTRLKAAFDRFIDVPDKNDREVAHLMRELEIDIAVDLNGHTEGARTAALALRPAPVAVNYLGFPATMGADYIDYIVADRYVIPPGYEAHYSEAVVRMPDVFQVNDSRRQASVRTPSRAEAGLPERGFVFCTFNRSNKISPPFFDAWMGLLKDIEGSVLWLVGGKPQVEKNLRAEAARLGVDPARLVFAAPVPYADHLARHRCADLFLDVLPFNAGTTTSDALFMGLPVVTPSGGAFAARMAGSLLTAVGLPELIAASMEEYIALASRLAKNPGALAETKAKLARNNETSPLFDTARFCRHLERAFVTMWERSQRGEKPSGFAVETIV